MDDSNFLAEQPVGPHPLHWLPRVTGSAGTLATPLEGNSAFPSKNGDLRPGADQENLFSHLHRAPDREIKQGSKKFRFDRSTAEGSI